MKILILARNVSYPINSGYKIRTWNFIKALGTPDNELFLLNLKSESDRQSDDENSTWKEWQKYFKETWEIKEKKPMFKNKISEIIWKISALLRFIPRQIAEAYSSDFETKFMEILKLYDFDIIFARYIQMGQYPLRIIRDVEDKVIIDLDDNELVRSNRKTNLTKNISLYTKLNRMVNNIILHFYYKKLKFIRCCIVCSEMDKKFIGNKKWAKNICVIQNSLEIDKYKEVKDFDEKAFKEKKILFCGTLNYEANIDGLKWFVREVFPSIRREDNRIKLCIVGANPHAEVYKYAKEAGASIHPNVPSVIQYYQDCSLVVVPLRFAGGTRIKIIESFACRRPVVSTTIGAEGLNLINLKHIIIQDEAKSFASACLKLLNDFNTALKLTKESYSFINEDYDTENTAKLVQDLFNQSQVPRAIIKRLA